MKLIRLTANSEKFRDVVFKNGLNLIIGERSSNSSNKNSRNGVGKTSLLQAIDFCLGGSVRDGDSLFKLLGEEIKFTLYFEVNGTQISVSRQLDDQNLIVVTGQLSDVRLSENPDESIRSLGLRTWTAWLGDISFGPQTGSNRKTHAPSFRQLIGHLLRFRKDAYIEPFLSFRQQKAGQTQVDNAFLLNLNWNLAVERLELKDRENRLGVLGRKELDEIGDEIGELETTRAQETARLNRLRNQIQSFEVLPEYRDIEQRANSTTEQLQNLHNEMLLRSREIQLYQKNIAAMPEQDAEHVLAIFEQAGLVLGNQVVRSLDEVLDFQMQVSANRKTYLEFEINRLEAKQTEMAAEVEHLDAARRQDLSLLESSGALDDFLDLQQRLGALAAALENLTQRIEDLRQLRKGKTALKQDILQLEERTEQDLQERRTYLETAINLFASIFDELYGEAADLIVTANEAGYKFKVNLPRSGSTGTGKVGVIAYDLVISRLWAEQQAGLGFLAHDSVVFDGIDEVQRAGIISIGKQYAEDAGFQYLVTLNSDDLPSKEFERIGLSVDQNCILRLSDVPPEMSLFGERF